ncbi:hypothetical protein D3C87_253480 [compost metagenome]
MVRGLIVLLSLSTSLQAFAQTSEVTMKQIEDSYQVCLEDAAQKIVAGIEEKEGKSDGAGYKKGACNEDTMTCTIHVQLQYNNENGQPLRAVIASQDVIFMEQEHGLCSDTILLGDAKQSLLRAQ